MHDGQRSGLNQRRRPRGKEGGSSFLYQSSWNKPDDHTIPYHTHAAPHEQPSSCLMVE